MYLAISSIFYLHKFLQHPYSLSLTYTHTHTFTTTHTKHFSSNSVSVTNMEKWEGKATWNVYVVNGNISFKFIDVGRQVDMKIWKLCL